MTQTDPVPQQVPTPAPITEADIWARICVRASELLGRQVRFGHFALGQLYVFWKGEPQADGSVPARGVTVYERGKPAPIKASLGIMAMFGFADDFVRVYALPIDPNGGDLGPARITLSRTAPVSSAFVEYIPMDQFVAVIADEVAGDLEPEEEEEEEGEEEEEQEEGADTNGFTPT